MTSDNLSDNPDKRRATRIPRRFILRVAIFTRQPLAWSHVTIKNLSSSGIYFAYERPVEIGQVLAFKIDFPGRVIECMGQVVRVDGGAGHLFSNVAAVFQGMPEADQVYIEGFVSRWRPGM